MQPQIMAELIMPFGIGFFLGIILFLVLERMGCIDKWLGLETVTRQGKGSLCTPFLRRHKASRNPAH